MRVTYWNAWNLGSWQSHNVCERDWIDQQGRVKEIDGREVRAWEDPTKEVVPRLERSTRV